MNFRVLPLLTRTCQEVFGWKIGRLWVNPFPLPLGSIRGGVHGDGIWEIPTGGIDFPISGGEFTIEMSVRAKDSQESVLLEHTSGTLGMRDSVYGSHPLGILRSFVWKTVNPLNFPGEDGQFQSMSGRTTLLQGDTLRLWANCSRWARSLCLISPFNPEGVPNRRISLSRMWAGLGTSAICVSAVWTDWVWAFAQEEFISPGARGPYLHRF